MATTNSLDEAQKLYNKVKSKIKSLPVELKEIINANLLSSLQTDFSALDATEMEDLKNDLAALIDNPSISDEEKKKFQTLQREILSRYPQKLDLLPEHADFLVSRDYLAKLLAENRFQNGSQHRNQGIPAGKIQLQLGVEIEISSVKGYNNLISDYEDAINRKDQKKLEKLDTELAERLILENNKWVQIDNDTLKPGDTDYKDE
ncbi:MAG: hypothetical protein LBG52_07815 [Candidatus Peribacteria bacterium]|jgi:hypothetical protein|nr:hypothetical protein [Candidatus Peribacteria bacterium]